jgi:hypothetical protein
MILERFCLQDAKPTAIPMNAGTILSTDQLPSTSEETNEMGDVPYQRGIGSLMYATTSTCPDIAFPITILSQFMHNPGQIHWEVVKDVICYCKGNPNSLREQLSLKTNQGESKENALRNPD